MKSAAEKENGKEREKARCVECEASNACTGGGMWYVVVAAAVVVVVVPVQWWCVGEEGHPADCTAGCTAGENSLPHRGRGERSQKDERHRATT